MAKNVIRTDIAHLADTVMQVLGEEHKYISETVTERALEKTAKETAEEIKQKAPRRKGDYAESWTYGYKKRRGNKTVIYVYSERPHYRLAHLLEKGHALRGGGRWEPTTTHIDPANKKIEEKLVAALQEELKK